MNEGSQNDWKSTLTTDHSHIYSFHYYHYYLFKDINHCLPQKHLVLYIGITIITILTLTHKADRHTTHKVTTKLYIPGLNKIAA